MHIPFFSLVVIAISGAQQPAITRPDGRSITPAQIDSTVNRLIQAAHVTGASVALFHHGEVVYLKAYGLRDAEKDLPLRPDSVMTLGPERWASPNSAGSMLTTLRDYATFLTALLHKKPLGIRTTGLLFNRQIAIHSAHQFPSLNEETTTAYDGIRLSYGLGWGLYSSPYGKAFFKEGHDEGWRNLALIFREHGDGILILTNSSNGEGIFKPLIEALLGETGFPFDWEGYTPYDKLPPLPKLKEHKRVTLTADQLNRLAGKYALTADIVLTVTVENGHLFIRENDEEKQEYLAESPNDFYSTTSADECSFKPETGPAQVLVLHLDNGQNPELKRVP